MIRAFLALALPEAVRADLSVLQLRLPVARVVRSENLHLTLLFLGELPEPDLSDADLAFRGVKAPGFEITLAGLGIFGGARPRAVYAGVATEPALTHLQSKLLVAARSTGLAIKARRFLPHVTLARLNAASLDRSRLEAFVASRSGPVAPHFPVEDYRLFRSRIGRGGVAYEELARYPLG